MSMKRNRIFIEADSLASHRKSGVGKVCLELARQFDDMAADQSIDVTLIVPPYGRDEIARLGFKNITVKYFPHGYKYFNALLTRLSLPLPADLLFGKGLYIFPNFKNWWVPYSRSITYIHDAAFVVHPETVEPRNLDYLRGNIRRWLNRTDRIVTVSGTSSWELQGAFPAHKDKINYVYNGVNTAMFYPRPREEVLRVNKSLNLPANYFVYIGNLEPRKNLAVLLDGYERYHKNSQVKRVLPLVIVGGGGWKNEVLLAKIAALQERGVQVIQPCRYVEDSELPAVISGSTALVHVPIHEGFGMTPLEALSCGRRVMVSDIPVLREVLSPVVEGIVFVNPVNVEAIANGLMELSSTDSQPRDTIELVKKYPWKNTALDLIKIIDTIDK